ncbi:MAG: hypothetical protein A3K09_08565 [Nitrospinae bacterium RIFCSPLOWO2_12_FULL_47_7]|nr:MAG: hypothetical protein A3K09_08565 [Nitrospinae bacterium RIFCSPLOWO2_12_FULL_47_7]
MYYQFKDESRVTFIPFQRIDSVDSSRTHFDLRELSYVTPNNWWMARLGVRKEYWGVTETLHLVDIVNQTDLVEQSGGKDKLGQPMANFSVSPANGRFGMLDFFVLPYFRERTFPGTQGRLRPSLPVDTSQAQYQSPDKEHHVDYAARYFHRVGGLDLGLSHFTGTGREPAFRVGTRGNELVLVPYYQQIHQTGIDALYAAGNWLWKFEGIRRNDQVKDFYAATGGFEYTFSGIGGSGMDLGVLGEYLYDDRGYQTIINDGRITRAIFNKDVSFGFRWGLNDYGNTSLLGLVIQSVETDRKLLYIEASHRFGDHWKATLEYHGFLNQNQPTRDALYDIRQDDYVRVALFYYFTGTWVK